MDDLTTLLPGSWASYITLMVALASFADATIPQPQPGSRWTIPRKALHMLALNVGHARNVDSDK